MYNPNRSIHQPNKISESAKVCWNTEETDRKDAERSGSRWGVGNDPQTEGRTAKVGSGDGRH